MAQSQPLPPELWLEVFEWATDRNYQDSLSSGYSPFQPISSQARNIGLTTAKSLSLVCKTWQSLIIDLLYQDIKIENGVCNLRRILGSNISGGKPPARERYGDLVRISLCIYRIRRQPSTSFRSAVQPSRTQVRQREHYLISRYWAYAPTWRFSSDPKSLALRFPLSTTIPISSHSPPSVAWNGGTTPTLSGPEVSTRSGQCSSTLPTSVISLSLESWG